MEEEKKKRKRVKGKKVMSSGSIKPYPIQEEILTSPSDDGEGTTYNIKKK